MTGIGDMQRVGPTGNGFQSVRRIVRVIAGGALLIAVAGCTEAPMTYTVGWGIRNYPVVNLLWALLITSLAVIAIVTVILLAAMLRHRSVPPTNDPRAVPLIPAGQGLMFVYISTAVSAAILVGAALWTFSVLAQVSGPPSKADLSLYVTGHQWWWEVGYGSDNDTSRVFTTANEIHVPTGKRVRLNLSSADVIHSFWVPQLTGKTDLIPGQNNQSWLEADRPGTYRGQCGEYCGLQHAHMALAVIAEPQDRFDQWWADQLKPAPTPQSPQVAAGERQFIARCGICHTVRGTRAGGRLGPDLSHLMTRTMIAAGTLPNTIGYRTGWITDPQHAKPGNWMPILDLSGAELNSIETYLETLK